MPNQALMFNLTRDADPATYIQWYRDLTGRSDLDMLYVHGTAWPNPVGWDHSRRLPKRNATLTGGPYSATRHSTLGSSRYLAATRTGTDITTAYPAGFTLFAVAKRTSAVSSGLIGNEAGAGTNAVGLLMNSNSIIAIHRNGGTSYSNSMGFTAAGGDAVDKYNLILASFVPGETVKLHRLSESPASTTMQTEEGAAAGGALPNPMSGGTNVIRVGRSHEATYINDHDQIMAGVIGASLGADSAARVALYEHIRGVLADYGETL